MAIKTFDEAKGKSIIAGVVKGDTFHRKVDKKKEFMRVENGYGISVDVINQLIGNQTEYIEIDDGIKKWRTNVSTWKNQTPKNYGHGIQHFLPITAGVIKADRQMRLF